MLKTLTARLIAGAFVLGIVIALLFFGPAACQRMRSQDAQSKVDRGQHDALQNSAADAVNTGAGVATNQAATEELTRTNEREIRNAQGANDAVNPAVRDAGLRSLCRRAASRHDPRCRLLEPPAR